MKVLLIVPRYNLTNTKNYNYVFPLGLAYISSAIKNAGYKLDCINLNHLDGRISEIVNKKLSLIKYDYVCTGHMCIGYHVIKEIFSSVKSHQTHPKIILGGAIITSEPEYMFNLLEPDFGILGEGEITIVELLKCLKEKKDLSKVKGIIYKDNKGKLLITEPRPVIEDLDTLPLPDFEGFEFEEKLNNSCSNDSYTNNLHNYPRPYPLLCSRSCPYQCTFCYHPLGRKYRKRSIKHVMEELEIALKKYKINAIEIYDDLFSVDKERLYEFCKEIKELVSKFSWKCTWSCQLAVNNVDEEMLNILKDSGCNIISYGFESMNKIVLKSMQKPITPQQINNAILLTMKNGLNIQGNFIFGDIAETRETAYKTLNYWKKNSKGQISLDFIQPYPGSKIYEHCIKKGIIKDKFNFIENISDRYFLNMTDKMNDDEIQQLKKDILKAMEKYRKSVTYLSLKKKGKEIYKIKAKCPFCKKLITYNNFRIENRFYFSHFMICKNCKFRFGINSPLKTIIKKIYPSAYPLMAFYVKFKRNIQKKRV